MKSVAVSANTAHPSQTIGLLVRRVSERGWCNLTVDEARALHGDLGRAIEAFEVAACKRGESDDQGLT